MNGQKVRLGPLALLIIAVSLSNAGKLEPRPQALGPEASSRLVEGAISRVYPAIVRIQAVITISEQGRLQKIEGVGSGVIISEEGHVVTNHHVAGKAKRLICRMVDGQERVAVLVGTDPLSDIAVLRLLPPDGVDREKYSFAVFGDSGDVRVGETVLALGSPWALSQSVTLGIVSNTAMILPDHFMPRALKLDGEEIGSLVRWIGHDAAISPGNSGGPLVNLRGEIIGVNEIGLALGGAIPGNLVKEVAGQIIEKGEVRRSWTGLECQPRFKGIGPKKGILVGGVVPSSPAEKAGMKPGDVILSVDGSPVDCRIKEDLALFNQRMLAASLDKGIEIAALRAGEERRFTLQPELRQPSEGRAHEFQAWGMTACDFTRASAIEHWRQGKRGVLVDSVRAGGASGSAIPPMRRGDVIVKAGKWEVGSLADLAAATRDLAPEGARSIPVLVAFERESQSLLTLVRLGPDPPSGDPATVRRAWLPASTQVLTRDLAEALGISERRGARVTRVVAGSVAELAGLKVGDILVALDGQAIDASQPHDEQVLSHMIRRIRVGSEAAFDVLREGKIIQMKMVLPVQPTPAGEMKRYRDPDLEFTVRDLSFHDRQDSKLDTAFQAVVVEGVEHAGWAALGRVAPGDLLLSIDGIPTPDSSAVEVILGRARDKRAAKAILFVRRGIHTQFLELDLPWAENR